MKKGISIFLAILLFLCFVGCGETAGGPNSNPDNSGNTGNNNNNNNDDGLDDIFEQIQIEIPDLPDPIGEDPFEGLTELFYTLDKYNKVIVDTENKRMLGYLLYDEEFEPQLEYAYTYNTSGNKITVSLAVSKVLDPFTGEIIPVQDYFDSIITYLRLEAKDFLLYVLEELSDSTEKAEIIEGFNLDYGTNFTVDEFTEENIDSLVDEFLNSPENKEYLGELLNTAKLATETIKQFTVSIESKDGTTAKIVVEGIYDTSKKWYEQPSGVFRGENENSNDNINSGTISHTGIKVLIVNDEYYYIESIDDTTIKTEEFDENEKQISFTYTTVGTGKDTVVKIDLGNEETLDITWDPDNVFNYGSYY